MANVVKKPSDPAIKYTDAEIKLLDEKIQTVFSEAQSDIQSKLDSFNAKFKEKDAEFAKKCLDGEISKEDYAAWRKGQVFTGKQWVQKKKEIAAVLDNSNKIASAMINQSAVNVFGENLNFMGYSLEHTAGVNFGFGLYNQDAVAKLIKDNPQLLPKWKIDQKKDYIWNQKNLNNALTQGIVQGESLDKISKRVSTGLAGKNENLMKTFAKTGMTQAQNSGRLERMKQADTLGIKVKKKWVATLDARTRITHQELDGETAKLDGDFKVEGMSIRYPGDPEAHPSLVYNCRCALDAEFDDYPATYDRYDNIAGVPIKGMSYNQWKEAKSKGDNLSPVPLTYKTFKNKQQQLLEDLFKNKSITGLYNEIKAQDSKTAGQLWKTMGEDGKPSDNWKKYIDGTLPKAQATKIDNILMGYGEKSGLVKEPVNIAEAFKDKKMSNVFNEIKAVDGPSSTKFYNDLKKMGKPSSIWDDYLNGKLSDADKLKIDAHLEKYLKKLEKTPINNAAEIAIDYSKYGGKELFETISKYDNFSDFASYASSKEQNLFLSQFKGKSIKEMDDAFTEAKKLAKAQSSDAAAEKAAKETENLIKLTHVQKELNTLEKDLAKINKTYSGIWKEEVTLADYANKKSAISAKKKYFTEQIEKAKSEGAAAKISTNYYDLQINKFEGYLKDLDEFEKLGKKYEAQFVKRDALRKEVNVLSRPIFTGVDFSDERKAAAKWYTASNYGTGDKWYSSWSKPIHASATSAQKSAYRSYTSASGGFNRPLAGFDAYSGSGASGWSESNFKGVGKVSLDNEGKGNAIKNLTSFVEKSKMPEDAWVQTAQNFSTLEGKNGFLGIDYGALRDMSDSDLNQFIGTVAEFPQFISGAINRGGGSYNPGQVRINIFVPKDSEALYVMSDGTFGKHEHEIILQRGGTYRITKMYWGTDAEHGGRKLFVDMELHPEMGYDKF